MSSTTFGLHPSLRLLLRLDTLGGWKKFLKGLASFPGLIAVTLFCCVFFAPADIFAGWYPYLHTFGGFALLFAVLANISIGLSGATVYFSPPENQFLMTEPLSDRQILAYRIINLFLKRLYFAAGFAFIVGHPAGVGLAVFFRAYPFLCAAGLSPLAICPVSQRVNATTLKYIKKPIDVAVITMIVFGSLSFGGYFLGINSMEAFVLANLPWIHVVLAPFFWASDFLLQPGTENTQLIFAVSTALCFACAALAIFYLDIRNDKFIAHGHRSIESIQNAKRRGVVQKPRKKAAFDVSDFGYMNGIGPTLWRKCREYSRNIPALMIMLIICLFFSAFFFSFLFSKLELHSKTPSGPNFILYWTQGAIIFLAYYVSTLDFKVDTMQMEALKALPLGSPQIVLGQTLISSLCVLMTTLISAVFNYFIYVHYFPAKPALTAMLEFVLWGIPLSFLYSTALNSVYLTFPNTGAEDRKRLHFFQAIAFELVLFGLIGFYVLTLWVSNKLDMLIGNSGFASAIGPLVIFTVAAVFSFRVTICAYDRFDVSKISR